MRSNEPAADLRPSGKLMVNEASLSDVHQGTLDELIDRETGEVKPNPPKKPKRDDDNDAANDAA